MNDFLMSSGCKISKKIVYECGIKEKVRRNIEKKDKKHGMNDFFKIPMQDFYQLT